MTIKTVKLSELSEAVRAFLGLAREGEGVVVEDESGSPRYGIVPYPRVSTDARTAALERLAVLQRQTRSAMQAQGVDEDDIDRVLQESDEPRSE